MDILWNCGASSVRDIQQALPAKRRPAYTTVQTTVFRMEAKGIVGRAGQSGNAYLFRPLITRENAQHALIEDLLSIFGGRSEPVMAHLVNSGRLSLKDVREAEAALKARRSGKHS
ncbi:BlaI/MecI/CopY family transcriptional regulator [Silvibacterium dinghuense]|uniref:BlaI/MecI/CopY family transcriptional regulator n=2 Tax=Silvibacterium dinghuense TaxID=1560006 RepID=A0A4Q1SAI5_9BACT|nr:BlaI/MecI/CopY family transcriptional regulator [Silvibacterium dinghuense]